METSYLFHNREEGRAAAAWAQRPGMTQALEKTPPQTPLQCREEEMSSSLLLGVLPLLDFTGAGRSSDGSFHRARTSPQDMRFSTALLNTSWKSATSHEKKKELEVVSPSLQRGKLLTLFVLHPNIFFKQNISLVKQRSQKPGGNLGTTFPLRWQSLLGKIRA